MLDFLKKMADGKNSHSFSNQLRNKRFAIFEQFVKNMPRPLHIIDIGGTTDFWEKRKCAGKDEYKIVLVNLFPEPSKYSNITSQTGTALNLKEFPDKSFDVAFSNSVIEHLFTFENQKAMANEIRRVARSYYVQTPNYWFPIEPHFLMPFWHWLPESIRIAIIRRRSCGWRSRCENADHAQKMIREIKLLTRRKLNILFPDATIFAEKFFGFNKSWYILKQ